MRTKADVNRRFKAEGLPLELVKGPGYLYFVYDDGPDYATESHCVNAFNQLSASDWYAMGVAFASACRAA